MIILNDKTISKSQPFGNVNIIASKSYIHRALIASSLCKESSVISNVTYNDDIIRTITSLNKLGANIQMHEDHIIVNPIDTSQLNQVVEINAHESGSTLRFLIPLASFLCDKAIFVGSERLLARPQSVYQKLYAETGSDFIHSFNSIQVSSFPQLHEYHVAGDVSSQFITGLMFTLPLLSYSSKIVLTSKMQSEPYVNMTIQILKLYGVKIKVTDYGYYIEGNQTYVAQDVVAEGDFSQAAFFAVLAAINNDITISNLNFESTQGDKEILRILKNVGIKMTLNKNSITIHKGDIQSTIIDLKHIPDLGPILFVLALFSEEKITFTNIERLRIKESDRVESMRTELSKFGAKIEVYDNMMTVYRLETFNKVKSVYAHNDHRVAMALAILATTLDHPLIIEDSKSVKKSYPKFFLELEKLNIKIK